MYVRNHHLELARNLERCRLRISSCFHYQGTAEQWNHQGVQRDFSAIYLVTGGDGFVRSRGRTFEMAPGETILQPANDRLDLGCRTTVAKWTICFSLVLHSGRDLLSGLPTMSLGPYSQALYDSLGALVEESPGAAWLTLQAETMRMLVPLADGIVENLRLEALMRSRYKPILDEIGPEPDASLRVSDLAEAMQMPLASLSRGFKRDFGIPLKQFLSERVNQRACDLLLASEASASSVARDLGFSDELYFYRFFRRLNGMTPSEFRRSVAPR